MLPVATEGVDEYGRSTIISCSLRDDEILCCIEPFEVFCETLCNSELSFGPRPLPACGGEHHYQRRRCVGGGRHHLISSHLRRPVIIIVVITAFNISVPIIRSHSNSVEIVALHAVRSIMN